MSIVITERPRKNVLDTNVSNWTAGHNPIIYKFKREDFKIVSIVSGTGGKTSITLLQDVSDFIKLGESAYIYSEGKYDNEGQLLEISIDGKTILLDIDYDTDAFNGYINLKQLYYVSVDLYQYRANTKLFNNSLRFFSDIQGNIQIDLSGPIKTKFVYENNLDYTQNNVNKNESNSIGFYLVLIENFRGKSPVDNFSFNDQQNPTFVTNSAKQFGDVYGQNMGEYLTFPELYPAQVYTTGNDSYNNFTYDENSDTFIILKRATGEILLYKDQTNTVLHTIDVMTSFDSSVYWIDCFSEYNTLAIQGDSVGGQIVVFFDLEEIIKNQNISVLWQYSTGSFDSLFRQVKIGKYLYNWQQGFNVRLYQYDIENQTTKFFTYSFAGLDIAQYGETLAFTVAATPTGAQGIQFINVNTFSGNVFLDLQKQCSAIEYNEKGEIFLYDNPNKKLLKINSQGQLEESNISFTSSEIYEIIIPSDPDEEQNKGFVRDEGKIIGFDLNTLELIESYEDAALLAFTNIDFKFLKSKLCTGGQINQPPDPPILSFILIQVYKDKLAKFLTGINKPRMWKGYPFSLSFIYSEKLERFVIFYRVWSYDQNGDLISTEDINISTQNRSHINDIIFNSLPESTCTFKVQVINSLESNREYSAIDYSTIDYR